MPVRAPPACGNSSGQRQLVTVVVSPAAPLEWTPGYSLYSPFSKKAKEEQSSPTLPIGHRVLSLASPKSTDSLREVRASAPDSVPPRRSTRSRCVPSRQFPVRMRFCGENLWFCAEISCLSADLAISHGFCRWAASPAGSLVLRLEPSFRAGSFSRG